MVHVNMYSNVLLATGERAALHRAERKSSNRCIYICMYSVRSIIRWRDRISFANGPNLHGKSSGKSAGFGAREIRTSFFLFSFTTFVFLSTFSFLFCFFGCPTFPQIPCPCPCPCPLVYVLH